MKIYNVPAALALFLNAGLALSLQAQTPSTSQKSTDSGSDAPEEALMLPEFSVNANTSHSYTAGDTVSGSRMNVAVKDLPYSINSLTSDFLKDFSIFSLTDDLSYISGITGNSDSFTFSVRGYTPANNVLYNGHFQTSPAVAAFVERVELIKGTSSSIYGQGSPGGALLITTYQPRAIAKQSLMAAVGTAYDFSTMAVHSTGPIPIPGVTKQTLFYNVDASYQHRTFDVPGAHRLEKAAEAGLTWKPDDKTSITVEGVWQKFWLPVGGEWGLPFLTHFGNNPNTGKTGQLFFDGFAWPLREQYYASPIDYVTRESTSWVGTIQHRFTDWLSFQASYNRYIVPVETYNTLGSSGDYFPSVGLIAGTTAVAGTNNVNTTSNATPSLNTIMGTGWSYSADLLAHYHIGNVDNQTLFTFDDYLNNRRNYTGSPIAGTYIPALQAFNPFAPITSPYIPRDTNHWLFRTTLNNAVESRGFNLAHRAVFFGGKLSLTGGYRHDYVTGYQSDPTAATDKAAYTGAAPGSGRESKIHSTNDGGSLGVSVALTSSFSWYAGISQSFLPFGTSVPLTVTLAGNPFAQQQQIKSLSPATQKATGGETGFKLDYLDHALTLTADVFKTNQKNVGVTELSDPTNPSSQTVTVNEGDQNAQGFEFDGQYNKGAWTGYVSYTYLDSEVQNQGINILANGRRPRAAAFNSLSAAVTYAVPHVKGLKLLSSMRFQGNTPQQSPSTGGILNPVTGLNDQNNGQGYLRTPAYAVWNFGGKYVWRMGGSKLEHCVNVMLKNAFNRDYLQPGNSTDFVGDKRGLYFTYSASY